jgi:hypothetical protein
MLNMGVETKWNRSIFQYCIRIFQVSVNYIMTKPQRRLGRPRLKGWVQIDSEVRTIQISRGFVNVDMNLFVL